MSEKTDKYNPENYALIQVYLPTGRYLSFSMVEEWDDKDGLDFVVGGRHYYFHPGIQYSVEEKA